MHKNHLNTSKKINNFFLVFYGNNTTNYLQQIQKNLAFFNFFLILKFVTPSTKRLVQFRDPKFFPVIFHHSTIFFLSLLQLSKKKQNPIEQGKYVLLSLTRNKYEE